MAATAELQACEAQEAAQLSRQLMGLFRKGDFEDPEMFSLGVAANFAEFPLSIGRQVVDPVRGLPAKAKFPPTISEVREALEAAMMRRRAVAYRAKWMLDEHERRAAEDMRRAAMTPERRAEVIAKVSALFKTTADAARMNDTTTDPAA